MNKTFSKIVTGAAALVFAAACFVVAAPQPAQATELSKEVVSMNRLYNPFTGEHLYTANDTERDSLVKLGWEYEGVGWYAPTKSDTAKPVYRLYNPYAPGGDHHYTMNEKEYEACAKAGWQKEGIAWYSDGEEAKPLYRQYNPNAASGSHNYTTSKYENNQLVLKGWKAEGKAWYGLSDEVAAKAVAEYYVGQNKSAAKIYELMTKGSTDAEDVIFSTFTEEVAQAAVDALDVDWNEVALKRAKELYAIDSTTFSGDGLREHLILEGFTEEQEEYAMAHALDK